MRRKKPQWQSDDSHSCGILCWILTLYTTWEIIIVSKIPKRHSCHPGHPNRKATFRRYKLPNRREWASIVIILFHLSNSPWQKHTPIINYVFVINLDISETKSSYFVFLQECLSNPWPFIYVFFMFVNECTLLVLGIYCYKTNYSISGWKQHKHYLTVFVG